MNKPDYAREAFDTNFDYEYAAEQRRNPQKGLVQIMGEKAVKWFRRVNERRKAEKAERTYKGSLDEIAHAIEPAATVEPQEPYLQPHKTPKPGEYRSMHAIHSMEEQAANNREGTFALDDEMAELMHGAVQRARQKIAADGDTRTTTMRAVGHETGGQHEPHDDERLVKAAK